MHWFESVVRRLRWSWSFHDSGRRCWSSSLPNGFAGSVQDLDKNCPGMQCPYHLGTPTETPEYVTNIVRSGVWISPKFCHKWFQDSIAPDIFKPYGEFWKLIADCWGMNIRATENCEITRVRNNSFRDRARSLSPHSNSERQTSLLVHLIISNIVRSGGWIFPKLRPKNRWWFSSACQDSFGSSPDHGIKNPLAERKINLSSRPSIFLKFIRAPLRPPAFHWNIGFSKSSHYLPILAFWVWVFCENFCLK